MADLEALKQAVIFGKRKDALDITQKAIAEGLDPEALINSTLIPALGVNQTMGASNISFGLPERHPINGVFLAMAAIHGMTCPILDPTVWEIRRSALITDLLLGKDEYCMNFISVYRDKFPKE